MANIDIKAKVNEIVTKLQNDKSLLDSFQKNPVAVVENLIGIDLPDDIVKNIVDGVKAKVGVDGLKSVVSGIGGLFGKK